MASYERSKEPWIITERLKQPSDTDLLLEIIHQQRNVLVVGERQSGKTSFLRWVTNQFEEAEKVLLYDFYSEINYSNSKASIVKVGYKEDANIKGNFNEFKELINKSLLFPFTRIVSDDLFGNEFDIVLNSLHDIRSGFFGVNQDSIENAIKFLFLKTIFPGSKKLSNEIEKNAASTFSYAIHLKEKIEIYELKYENGMVLRNLN